MAVTIINDQEFIKELLLHHKIIVKFFTDWCGSCRLFRPKFIRLSDEEQFKDIRFLDMNAEKNPIARKMVKVTHFPTFAIFRDGVFLESVATTREEIVLELIKKI